MYCLIIIYISFSMHTKLEVFTMQTHSTWIPHGIYTWIVVEKFSSELQFEPKPSRTEPQVQFKIWKIY